MNGWLPAPYYVGQAPDLAAPPPPPQGLSDFTKGVLLATGMILFTTIAVTYFARTSPEVIALSRRRGPAPLSVGWARRARV